MARLFVVNLSTRSVAYTRFSLFVYTNQANYNTPVICHYGCWPIENICHCNAKTINLNPKRGEGDHYCRRICSVHCAATASECSCNLEVRVMMWPRLLQECPARDGGRGKERDLRAWVRAHSYGKNINSWPRDIKDVNNQPLSKGRKCVVNR